MAVLVIDNYDSFTFNLVQYLGEMGAVPEVVRNDAAGIDQLMAMRPERVIVSPGPCTPAEAGVSVEAIRCFAEARVPVLGVCLGHRLMAQAYAEHGHARLSKAPDGLHRNPRLGGGAGPR